MPLGLVTGLTLAFGAEADQPQWGERDSRNMVSAETNLPVSFDPATGVITSYSIHYTKLYDFGDELNKYSNEFYDIIETP